jgi:dTDP-4-dehydrorhamnose reductase
VKTLVFGARGFLGQHFVNRFRKSTASIADIGDPDQVSFELDRHRPDVVINCAGKTGRPNVDWCELHKLETLRSNVTGPLVLLDECLKRDIFLVHVSSGCIYSGDNRETGFSEQDEPNFGGSYYSRVKAATDRLLSEYPVLILRPRMPFDDSLHERSLISKLKEYQQLINEANSLTYIPDMLDVAERLIVERQLGVFHVVNPGTISPFQIMLRYKEIVEPSHSFVELPVSQLSRFTLTGRSNCVLSTAGLERLGIRLRPITEAVDHALKSIAYQNSMTAVSA